MQLLLTGLILAVNLILGSAVFLNNRKRPLNIIFGLLVLSVAGWIISNYLTDNIKTVSISLFWNRASFAFAGLIGTFFLIFSHLFTDPKRRAKTFTIIIFLLTALTVFFTSFTPLIVRTVEIKSWGSNTVNGPLFFIFVVYFLGTIFLAMRTIVVRYKQVRGQLKQQIQYFFLGTILSLAFGTSTNLFSDIRHYRLGKVWSSGHHIFNLFYLFCNYKTSPDGYPADGT